jgi:hypothetical protein
VSDLPEFGIDELRRTVRLLSNCSETFNTRFTAEQLLKIGDAYRRCGWDITPDEWTEAQLKAALAGKTPVFGEGCP